MSHVRCPRCAEPLIKSQAGRLKMRLPLVAFRAIAGGAVICETVCPGCKADVPLPLTISDPGLQKSLTSPFEMPPGLRLTIRLPDGRETPLTPESTAP